jgi:hypothetical protein
MSAGHTIAIVIGAAILVAACTATVQNSPRQDLVWSAYNRCRAENRISASIQLTRVEPDGRTWYSTHRSAYGAQELERCINEKVSPPPTYVLVLTQ